MMRCKERLNCAVAYVGLGRLLYVDLVHWDTLITVFSHGDVLGICFEIFRPAPAGRLRPCTPPRTNALGDWALHHVSGARLYDVG